jgi:hypothetical protein
VNSKILISLLIISCLFVNAQTENKTIFGFKGGYNKSIVDAKEPDGTESGYIGYELYGSFFADTELSKKLNLENELLFSYTDDYHFIEIPIHMKYRIKSKWFVLAGPKLDFIADNDNDGFEAGYRFKNFGVSGELGIQYHFTKRFFAETRYSRSFTAQIDDLALDFYGGKRHTFRIGLGVKF